MSNQSAAIVQRLWNYCNVLRDDGIFYGDYCISQGHVAVRSEIGHNTRHYERNELSTSLKSGKRAKM
jgi:hypothetical protein